MVGKENEVCMTSQCARAREFCACAGMTGPAQQLLTPSFGHQSRYAKKNDSCLRK